MITVRPYRKSDFRYVQDICLKTSWFGVNPTPINRSIICSMYCDYYLDNEPNYCFVAVDDNDIPVGYTLCAVDLDKYREMMTSDYLPLVRKVSGDYYYRFASEVKLEQRYIKQGYTAHLHIDILDEYKDQAVGEMLLKAIMDKLHADFIEGVYLVCGEKDGDTRSFYEACGFDDIDYFTGCVVYAKKLYSEDE